MINHTEIGIIAASVAIVIIIIIIFMLLRRKSKTLDHRAPTQSVKKKVDKMKGGFIGGVYHCEPCGVAGHLFTLGAGPCSKCGKKMHMHEAKWAKVRKRWIFRKESK